MLLGKEELSSNNFLGKEVLTSVTLLENVCFAQQRGKDNGGDLKPSGGCEIRKVAQDPSRWRETVKALCVPWQYEDR